MTIQSWFACGFGLCWIFEVDVSGLLAVVGAGSVFAEEMFVQQMGGRGCGGWIDGEGFDGHVGDDFEGLGGFDRLGSGGPQAKGP
jgi:hypothetical protein